MEQNITLTNDEIHAIRIENSKKREKMGFREYQKQLDAEIAPALRMLEEFKKAYVESQKKPTNL